MPLFNRGYGLTELNTSVVPRSLVHSSPAWRGNTTANRTHSVTAGPVSSRKAIRLSRTKNYYLDKKCRLYRAFCMADHQ